MTQISDQQKGQILNDPVVKSRWQVNRKARWLIKKIDDYFSTKGEQWKNHPGFFTDEELEDVQDSQSNSDLQKAIQAFLNNRAEESLFELIDYEENRRNMQNKIRAELSIYDVKGEVKMKHFKPISNSLHSDINFNECIAKVGSVVIDGDFAPQFISKKTIAKKIEKTVSFETSELGFSKKEEAEIIKQARSFLQAKHIFLKTRSGTIERLQDCCDRLEGAISIGRIAKSEEIGEVISSVGTAFAPLKIGNPVRALGELMLALTNSSKRKLSQVSTNNFLTHLAEDEKRMAWFDEACDSLTNTIQGNKGIEISSLVSHVLKLAEKIESKKTKLFSLDYQVYDIINSWKGKKVLSAEEMKENIKLLNNNLRKLQAELAKEEREIKQLEQTYWAQQEQLPKQKY